MTPMRVLGLLALFLVSCNPTPQPDWLARRQDIAQLTGEVKALNVEAQLMRSAVERLYRVIPEPIYCRVSVKNTDSNYMFELKLDRTGCELIKLGKLDVLGKNIQ